MTGDEPTDRSVLLRRLGLAGVVLLVLLSPLLLELRAQNQNAPLHDILEEPTRTSLNLCEVDDEAMDGLADRLDPALLDVEDPDHPLLWIDLGDGRLAFDEVKLLEAIDRHQPGLAESERRTTIDFVETHVWATNEKQAVRELFSETRSMMHPVWWGRPIPKDWR